MRSLKDGLKLQAHAIKSGFTSTIVVSNQLINLYSKHGLINDARKLFDEMPDRNVFSWNTIINAYTKSRDFGKAKHLFDSSPYKDSVTYNSMISGYARSNGYETEAIKLFTQMQFENDPARIDEFTLTTMLNLFAKSKALRYGAQVHSFMVKSGNNLSGFALSSLIDMYSKCGSFLDAYKVVTRRDSKGLVDLVVKNALIAACCREGELETARRIVFTNPKLNNDVSWNTLISWYAQNGFGLESVELFKRMGREGYFWDAHTFASLLTACSVLKSLRLGKEVHARVLKDGFFSNPFISSGVVDIYCKCGDMRHAKKVYESFGMDNVFAATSMIVGYSMIGDVYEARRLFDSLGIKNSVMWTSIISGYVKLQKYEDAFVLFREYVGSTETKIPDVVILVSVIGACAVRADVELGKQIHAYILRMGIKTDEKAVTALIDMYSKCGFILYSRRIFLSVDVKDVVIYNVMISGCAHNGYEYEAITYFEEMIGIKKLWPDEVTFIGLLSACRHCGLVKAGENYFLSMEKDYGIKPEIEHYACMVDLYGRSNELEKAVSFMEKMPFEPDPIMLSTFLSACRANRNIELARMTEKKLMEIGGDDDGARYFQLASVYALGGEWDEMGRVMRTMRGKAKKSAGCSWVRAGNRVHSFISGDRSHCEAEALYCVLGCLIDEMCGNDSGVEEYIALV